MVLWRLNCHLNTLPLRAVFPSGKANGAPSLTPLSPSDCHYNEHFEHIVHRKKLSQIVSRRPPPLFDRVKMAAAAAAESTVQPTCKVHWAKFSSGAHGFRAGFVSGPHCREYRHYRGSTCILRIFAFTAEGRGREPAAGLVTT